MTNRRARDMNPGSDTWLDFYFRAYFKMEPSLKHCKKVMNNIWAKQSIVVSRVKQNSRL